MAADERTDEALVAQWVTGDEQAVDALLRKTWSGAYRVALALVGDPGAAEDVAQEAFVRAIKRASEFEVGAEFRPWFFGILRNVARERRCADRRRRRREEVAARSEAFSAEDPSDEDAVVRNHLRALPSKYRDVVALHYFEGLTFTRVEGDLCTLVCWVRDPRGRPVAGVEVWVAATGDSSSRAFRVSP